MATFYPLPTFYQSFVVFDIVWIFSSIELSKLCMLLQTQLQFIKNEGRKKTLEETTYFRY